jgi:hypothetical protein
LSLSYVNFALNITSKKPTYDLASARKLGYYCLLPGRTPPRPPSWIQLFLRQFASLHTEAADSSNGHSSSGHSSSCDLLMSVHEFAVERRSVIVFM